MVDKRQQKVVGGLTRQPRTRCDCVDLNRVRRPSHPSPPTTTTMSGGIYGPSTTSSSLVTPALSSLAQDVPHQIDAAALDFLLIESVRALQDSSHASLTRLRAREDEMIKAGLIPPAPPVPPSKDGISREEEEASEALRVRLEEIGVAVGGALAER